MRDIDRPPGQFTELAVQCGLVAFDGLIWHLLSDPEVGFNDLGADFHNTRTDTARKRRNHVRQLEALGFKVTLEPAA